jgi:hypothetical protein
VDGSAISRPVVIVNARPALRDELAIEHVEVQTRAILEPALAGLVVSVMMRHPVAVVMLGAAVDVCCVSFPCS